MNIQVDPALHLHLTATRWLPTRNPMPDPPMSEEALHRVILHAFAQRRRRYSPARAAVPDPHSAYDPNHLRNGPRAETNNRVPRGFQSIYSPSGRSHGALWKRPENGDIEHATLNHTPNHAEAAASIASHTAIPVSRAFLIQGPVVKSHPGQLIKALRTHPTIMAPYRALSHGSRTSCGISLRVVREIPSPKKRTAGPKRMKLEQLTTRNHVADILGSPRGMLK